MAQGKFVSYLRVSTKRQGVSGLGLEAQRKAVEDFLNGGRWTLLGEYVEVESGSDNKRTELQNALRACRLHGATLVVAKLDRLSRNAAFLMNLQESRVRFVACDMPEANEMVVGLLAVMAQWERKAISERTKAALRAAKARGVRLGNPSNLTNKARRKGNGVSTQVRAARALMRAHDLGPSIVEIQTGGASSVRQIAQELNKRRIPTVSGKQWSDVQVKRLLTRLNRENL